MATSCKAACTKTVAKAILGVSVAAFYFALLLFHIGWVVFQVIVEWEESNNECLLSVKIYGIVSLFATVAVMWFTIIAITNKGVGLLKVSLLCLLLTGFGLLAMSQAECDRSDPLYVETLAAVCFFGCTSVISFFWTSLSCVAQKASNSSN